MYGEYEAKTEQTTDSPKTAKGTKEYKVNGKVYTRQEDGSFTGVDKNGRVRKVVGKNILAKLNKLHERAKQRAEQTTDSSKADTEQKHTETEQEVLPTEDKKTQIDYSTIKPVGKGVFGNIYDQFKGKTKEAIQFLSRVKNGVVVNALSHKDVGGIDLVWGTDQYGLKKIAKKHPEMMDGLQEKINQMKVKQSSDNRIILESDTHKAVISKNAFGKEHNQWLLTAYEKKNTTSANSIDNETELNTSNRIDTAPPKSDVSTTKVQNKTEKVAVHNIEGRPYVEYNDGTFTVIDSRGVERKVKNEKRINQLKNIKEEKANVVKETIAGIQEKTKDKVETVFISDDKDLPQNVKNNPQYEPNKWEAVWSNGVVYFNLNKISDSKKAVAKWVHEVGVHDGLRKLIPEKEFNSFMERVYDVAKRSKDPKIKKLFEDVESRYKLKNKEDGSIINKAEVGEEVLAHLGEDIMSEKDLSSGERNLWKQAIAYLHKILGRTTGIDLSKELTDKDLAKIVRASVKSKFKDVDAPNKGKVERVETKTPYKDDKPHGVFETWDGDGQQLPDSYYIHGKEVTKKEYYDYDSKELFSKAPTLFDSDFDENGRVRPEVLAEIKAEREQIKKDAITNGTFMKAPNGKATNLNERQWIHVRTSRFKNWFGDWENAKLIQIAQNVWNGDKTPNKAIVSTSEKLQAKAKEIFGHKVDKIVVTDSDIRHIKNNHGQNEDSRGQVDITPEDIAVIPYVMNNFDTAIEDRTDNKGNKTIQFTKRVNGTTYVIGIEKGKDKAFVVTSWTKKKSDVSMQDAPKPNAQNDSDHAKVVKEVETIKNAYTDSSKVVDENGEPMPVFHNTDSYFNAFDLEKTRYNVEIQGHFFTPIRGDWADMGDIEKIVFLNIKNPIGSYSLDSSKNEAGKHAREDLLQRGYDGIILEEDGSVVEIVALSNNQIKSATDNIGTYSKRDNIRFSLIGEQGATNLDRAEERTHRMDNLRVAREMETANKDAKAIRLATGWERGADGKWRYEIGDRELIGSSIYRSASKKLEKVDTFKDWLGDNNGESLFTALDITIDSRKTRKKLIDKAKARGINIIDIFDAYPRLVEVKLGTLPKTSENHGLIRWKDYGEKVIRIREDLSPSRANSVLLHEIQHAVQIIEGFERGGAKYNPIVQQHAFNETKKIVEQKYGHLHSYKEAVKNNTLDDWVKDMANATGEGITPYEAYRRLAGETEARNVQSRLGMTEEQRRNTLLSETEDVAREDQIFLRDEERFSIAKNNKEFNDFVKDSEVKRTVYHATPIDGIIDFDPSLNVNADFPDAVYFNSNKNTALTYGDTLYKSRIKLKNPYYFDASGRTFNEAYDDLVSAFNNAVNSGKDGVIIDNIYDDKEQGGRKRKGTTYAVFDNENILIAPNQSKERFSKQEISDYAPKFIEKQRKVQKSAYKDYGVSDVMFSLGKRARAEYDARLIKNRKDLSDIDRASFLDFLHTIDDKKTERATFHWFVRGRIIVPEDMPKVEQAIKVSNRAKVDPMSYSSPMELIDANSHIKIKEKPIDPDTVPTLSNKVDYGNGIIVYNVQDDASGREDMRKIINTHYGKDRSPWCLLQGDENGRLTEDSERYWNHYSSIPKRVAFHNGKLLAFSANSYSDVLWWDRNDDSYSGIPFTHRVPNDELGRTGTTEFNENTRELGVYRNIHKGNKHNGLYEEWNDNGQQVVKANYKDGKEDGTYESWFNNGQQLVKANYKDGKLHGVHETWHNNGQQRIKQNYKDGERHGVHESWNDDGQQRIKENYKDGKEDGLYEEWYDNGQQRVKQNYKDGKEDGLYESWFDNGQQRVKGNQKDGTPHGVYESWYENGQQKVKGNYKDGKPHGVQETWNDNGELSSRKYYIDGIEKTKESYEREKGREERFSKAIDDNIATLKHILKHTKGERMPKPIATLEDFKREFAVPVKTPINEIRVDENDFKKILNMGRTNLSGSVRPTLEQPDFIIRDTDGSYLFTKIFEKGGKKKYNVVSVNKEDYLASVHIKSDNNLLNKLKNGAELHQPISGLNDEANAPNNSTPFNDKDTKSLDNTKSEEKFSKSNYDKFDLDHTFEDTNSNINKDNLKDHKLKLYKISGDVSNHTYLYEQDIYTNPNEAVEEASKIEHSDFNTETEVKDIAVTVTEFETDSNLYDIAKEGGFLDENGNLDDGFDVDDVIDYGKESDHDSTGESHRVKDLMGTHTANEIELAELTESAKDIEHSIDNEIQNGLKDYIHHQEEAGYMGRSRYYYFVRDEKGNLVKNSSKRFRPKKKAAYYDADRGHDVYNREYEKKRKSDKILQVRVSDHQGNNRNTSELVDGYLSISVEPKLLSPHSQKGHENPDKTFSSDFNEFSSNEDVRVTPDLDSVNPSANDIKTWLENTDAEWDGESGMRWSKQDLDKVNEQFNNELNQLKDGALPKGHIFQLGRPMEILRSAGMPNLPIELASRKLSEKTRQNNHLFSIDAVKDLPRALQNPLAVFRYGDKAKSQNVITEIAHKGKQILVGVHFNQNRDGLEVNSIRGLFPKDNAEWLNWVVQGKLLYVDKKRVQTLIDQQQTNLTDVEYLDLNSTTNIIQNFENPKSEEKFSKSSDSVSDIDKHMKPSNVVRHWFSRQSNKTFNTMMGISKKYRPALKEFKEQERDFDRILTMFEDRHSYDIRGLEAVQNNLKKNIKGIKGKTAKERRNSLPYSEI